MKVVIRIFALVLALSFIAYTSCDTEEEDPGSCTGCTSNAPWSKSTANQCYATQQDCENAEGPGCVICN